MKKILLRFILLLLGTACFSVMADIPAITEAPAQTEAQPATSTANLIFLQTAGSASVSPITNQPGYYYLTLADVNPYINYFSSRPLRLQGLLPISQFLTSWVMGSNSFSINNPNGAIVAEEINGEENTSTPLLITISRPVYVASKNVMQYIITPLYTQELFLKPFTLTDVTLIISS